MKGVDRRVYMNFVVHVAQNRRDRRNFLRHWRRVYLDDRRVTLPHHSALTQLRNHEQNQHLARLSPLLLSLEAIRRPRRNARNDDNFAAQAPVFSASLMEEAVAATALLHDRRQTLGTGYLGMLRCANGP